MDIKQLTTLNPYDYCFLCEVELNSDNKTKEHVFGDWMLKDFELKDKFIDLINGQKFKYSKLTIPCCKKCNNEDLSQVENIISAAVKGGYEKFIEVPDRYISTWLGKIYMGILIKETNLRKDIKDPESEKIHNEDILTEKYINFVIIRMLYNQTSIIGNVNSLFIFNVNYKEKYYYFSSPYFNSIMIIVNDIGIILFLQDGGLLQDWFNKSPIFNTTKRILKFQEFVEVYVRLIDFYLRNDYVPYFMTESNIDTKRVNNLIITNPYYNTYISVDPFDSYHFYFLLKHYIEMMLPGANHDIVVHSTFLEELVDK